VVYKKSGAFVGVHTMYSYQYGCKQRGIKTIPNILNRTVAHDSEMKLVNGVYAYEPQVKGFQDSTIKPVFVHAKLNTNGTLSVEDAKKNKEYLYSVAPIQSYTLDGEEGKYKYIWYDYQNKVWANIRINSNGVETNWVWIPRYAYKIEGSEVDIKFVNLDNQYYNIETNKWTNLEEGYLVAAAFEQDGSLKGIWMAKYHASQGQVNYEVSTSAEAVNKPKLDGFDPEKTFYVTYDSRGVEIPGGPIGTAEAPIGWYDYTAKKWANIKTVTKAEDGQELVSYWVWIPRYAYTVVDGQVDIIFVDINNNPKDPKYNGMYEIGESKSDKQFKVPAAFEQDGPLEGIWMAKYHASPLTVNYKVSTDKSAVYEPNLGHFDENNIWQGFDRDKTYYVTYDSSNKEHIEGSIGSVSPQDLEYEWYDYTAKKWANIKTENKAEDGQELVSYWVWIPRYAYTIVDGNVYIVFVDINNNPIDSNYEGMYDIGNSESDKQFKVPAAFDQDGQLKGIWMSKYHASKLELTTTE
jgi:hypothetical protein